MSALCRVEKGPRPCAQQNLLCEGPAVLAGSWQGPPERVLVEKRLRHTGLVKYSDVVDSWTPTSNELTRYANEL